MTRRSIRSAFIAVALASVTAGAADIAFSRMSFAQGQTEFTVTLTDAGADKLEVLKRLRAVTGLNLFEAKDLVENAPKKIKDRATKADAAQIKTELEKAGAKVDVK